MGGRPPSISPTDQYARLGTASEPTLVDVRPTVPLEGDRLIVSAFYHPPEDVKGYLECSRDPIGGEHVLLMKEV